MADKKISALTAATTPLAGTEVLPIVQSGATVKVAVSNLTAGRDVSASTLALNATGPTLLTITGTTSNGYASLNLINSGAQTYAVGVGGPTESGLGLANSFYIYDSTASQVRFTMSSAGDATVKTGNLILGTSGKGITNSTGSVALNFSTAGTSLNSAQSVLSGSFPNVGTAQTITITDTNGGYVVITGVQAGVGSSTWTLPFAKRGGSIAIGTPSKAILTADPILTVAASGGNIVVTPLAGNTYFTYAIYYTPLGA